MIAPARAAEILRLYHAEKWKPGTLARQLGVHHNTVRRVLAQAGQAPGFDSTRASLQPCAKHGRRAASIQPLGREQLTKRSILCLPLSIFLDTET